jgi:hypothetical protein
MERISTGLPSLNSLREKQGRAGAAMAGGTSFDARTGIVLRRETLM